MTAIVQRRITRWHILIGAGFVLTALLVVTAAASVAYVVANGVGYILTHAWWAR